MNTNDNKNIIFLWNLYALFFYPLAVFLVGFWSLETRSPKSYEYGGGIPIAILVIFLPEMILGLKRKWDKRIITILCSIIDGLLLNILFQRYFTVLTSAPITYYMLNCIIVLSLVWIIIIEFNKGLKEHILQYPQDQWLIPHSEVENKNKRWHFIWMLFLFGALGMSLMVKFKMI